MRVRLVSEQRDYQRTCGRLNGQIRRVRSLLSELHDFMASSYASPKLAIEDVIRRLENALAADAGTAQEASPQRRIR